MLIDGIIGLLTGNLNGTTQTNYTALIAAVVAANGAAPVVSPATPVPGSAVFKNELPRGYTLPALCIHRYGDDEDTDLSGPIGVRENQVQIDIYEDPSAEVLGEVYEAVRALLIGYVGTLPDGTVVSLIQLQRGMDMPFLPKADQKGIANRSLLGFRVVTRQ